MSAPVVYDVRLRVHYAYEAPANAGRHLLRLTPAELPGEQRLVTGSIDLDTPPDEQVHRADFFGNQTVEVAFKGGHDRIEIRMRARVRRNPAPPPQEPGPPLAELKKEIGAIRSLAPQSPHHFRGPSARVRLNQEMTDYARAASQSSPGAAAIVEAVGLALHRDMAFDAGATTVDTPAEEAFSSRHGVCQDFSHIMIACLRGLGMPAGYVSGYLRTRPPPGKPRLEGADAMHAWVRAWCGEQLGWVEYDPTNATFVSADHIVVARGRDYADVAPVIGVLRTSGTQVTDHAVDVTAV